MINTIKFHFILFGGIIIIIIIIIIIMFEEFLRKHVKEISRSIQMTSWKNISKKWHPQFSSSTHLLRTSWTINTCNNECISHAITHDFLGKLLGKKIEKGQRNQTYDFHGKTLQGTLEVVQFACTYISSQELLILFFMKVVVCVGLLNSNVFFCHWHLCQQMVQTIFLKK